MGEGEVNRIWAMLDAINAATDWKIVVPAIITGLTGLIGAWIGASGAVRAQTQSSAISVCRRRATMSK